MQRWERHSLSKHLQGWTILPLRRNQKESREITWEQRESVGITKYDITQTRTHRHTTTAQTKCDKWGPARAKRNQVKEVQLHLSGSRRRTRVINHHTQRWHLLSPQRCNSFSKSLGSFRGPTSNNKTFETGLLKSAGFSCKTLTFTTI